MENDCVGRAVTHRGRVEDDVEDVCPVIKRLILGDDEGLTFIVCHLMNASTICIKTKKGEGRMTQYSNLSEHTTHYHISCFITSCDIQLTPIMFRSNMMKSVERYV